MKSTRGRPKVETEPVMVRLSRELLEAIDEVRRSDSDLPTRPEVIRRAITDWLRQNGHLDKTSTTASS